MTFQERFAKEIARVVRKLRNIPPPILAGRQESIQVRRKRVHGTPASVDVVNPPPDDQPKPPLVPLRRVIVGFSGSLRRSSFNTMLLCEAAAFLPTEMTLDIASIRGIPLYDGDVEREQGIPEPVEALKERIVSADALLISTPEYNHSIPGVLKNAIDWLSRPPFDIPRVFGGRPVAIMGVSIARRGTLLAQAAWLPILFRLGSVPWFGDQLAVSVTPDAFDAQGHLVDEAIRWRLDTFVKGFAAFVAEHRV
jgi:chromate reductase, NAD(P)H dehydrogenase (quinone)